MVDFDPSLIFGDDEPKIGGIRKQCIDAKRCGLGLVCEHGQVRNESCELVSLWAGRTGECPNYTPRKELASENDLFRGKTRKHNQLRGSNLKPPNLMVKRHIRDGKDINGDGGD